MRTIAFITASVLLATAVFACKIANQPQQSTDFNYADLYRGWVVDTILILEEGAASTPNIEMDNNEYQFRKEGPGWKQGIRTTVTPDVSFEVPFTIEGATINFDPAATFPITSVDDDGQLVTRNLYASLPPYTIVALSPEGLSLKSGDILMKLKPSNAAK
ncbi:MAG: hypothetical protein RIC19_17120 [Phaeodactylibacter sp.]|uniref:hypothetical protein n=1 Tax=Phaeodactylibacter sp. TaxID=1940289 RepID=UPI0032EABA42